LRTSVTNRKYPLTDTAATPDRGAEGITVLQADNNQRHLGGRAEELRRTGLALFLAF